MLEFLAVVVFGGQESERFCRACLTGDYPTEIPTELRGAKLRFEPMAAAPAGG